MIINTYNLLSPDLTFHIPKDINNDERTDRIIHALDTTEGIICCQEVNQTLYNKMNNLNGTKTIIGYKNKGMGEVIIYDRTKYELLKSYAFRPSEFMEPIELLPVSNSFFSLSTWITGEEGKKESEEYNKDATKISNSKRMMTLCQFKAINSDINNNNDVNDVVFWVCNVHVPCMFWRYDFMWNFIYAAFRQVKEYVRQFDSEDAIIFFCGDFNMSRKQQDNKIQKMLKDFDMFDLTKNAGNTINTYTDRSGHFCDQIDYIFSNRDFVDYIPSKNYMSDEDVLSVMPNAISPSDHCLLTVQINDKL